MWRHVADWLWLTVVGVLCGYGERPERAIGCFLGTLFGGALVYFAGSGLPHSGFGDCLYFSGVSMTALGYGPWVSPDAAGWACALGLAQSFVGVFLMALFITSFTRKMTR